MQTRLSELVGKKIACIFVGEDEDRIVFLTNEGTIGYMCHGDCCSQTWIADLIGVDALIGGTVIEVETIELEDYNTEDGRSRQHSDCAYGEKITTNKGFAKLIYRNSSNGYYGGDIEFETELEIGDNAKQITEDFAG
jgi:hypothetical protein